MPIGLNNQGNTCYMDSALQLIVNSRNIRKCIMEQKGDFAKALYKIINACHTMTPDAIKWLMGYQYSRFAGYGYQDSHEFISLCIGQLENEERKKSKYYETVEYNGQTPEAGYYKFRNYCERIYDTSYYRVLRFYIILVTYCSDCGYDESYSFHEEESLILTLRSFNPRMFNAQSQEYYRYESQSHFYPQDIGYSSSQPLDNLLASYFKERILDTVCSKCGAPHKCKPYLWTGPKQLIIVLSRFSGSWQKVNDPIHFDLKLNLEQYFHKDSPYRYASEYDLNAVSLHSGSCGGGHYTAYVVDEHGYQWHCNDSWVSKCSIDLDDPRAYVFSYSVSMQVSDVREYETASYKSTSNPAEFETIKNDNYGEGSQATYGDYYKTPEQNE